MMLAPELNAYPLHSHIAHSRLVVLKNVGHALPQTQSEAIVEAIHTVWEPIYLTT